MCCLEAPGESDTQSTRGTHTELTSASQLVRERREPNLVAGVPLRTQWRSDLVCELSSLYTALGAHLCTQRAHGIAP